jgi:hypothetical protein
MRFIDLTVCYQSVVTFYIYIGSLVFPRESTFLYNRDSDVLILSYNIARN